MLSRNAGASIRWPFTDDGLSVCFVGFLSSGSECLWEPVPGADWQYFRVHRHTRPTHNHQLSARPAVQVQLQLPPGVSGEQHTAGIVSSSSRLKLHEIATNYEKNTSISVLYSSLPTQCKIDVHLNIILFIPMVFLLVCHKIVCTMSSTI